jgi:hypothetical protein
MAGDLLARRHRPAHADGERFAVRMTGAMRMTSSGIRAPRTKACPVPTEGARPGGRDRVTQNQQVRIPDCQAYVRPGQPRVPRRPGQAAQGNTECRHWLLSAMSLPAGRRALARWRLTWPSGTCHPMDRARFRMWSGRTRQGLPGGRAIPPGPGHWPTAARPPRGFGIERTGKAGIAAHQALGATRTATGNNGRATVCNGTAGAGPGPPVAHFAAGCPQGHSWVYEAARQRSSRSACCVSCGGEPTPPGRAAAPRDRSRPGNGLNPAVTTGQPE